jgi:hypothetical protein
MIYNILFQWNDCGYRTHWCSSIQLTIPEPRSGSINAQDSQSTTWQVDNPKEPLFFTWYIKGC